MKDSNSGEWDVPYLPIDPEDVGAVYEEVIRINSQSGKGGIAYIMEEEYGVQMPRNLQIEFSRVVQGIPDTGHFEDSRSEQKTNLVGGAFETEYLKPNRPTASSTTRRSPTPTRRKSAASPPP